MPGSIDRPARERVAALFILQSADDLALIGSSIPEAEIVVCRLDVTPAVLAARISYREAGSARSFLTKASAELAVTIAALDLHAFVVDNGATRSIPDLATEVLELIAWPRPAS